MKTCRRCELPKPLQEFPPRKSAADGRRNECRDCTRAFHRGWSADHREEIRDQRLVRSAAHEPRVEQRCSSCGLTKPAAAFGKESQRAGGLQGACRECRRLEKARWDRSNRVRVRSYARERYRTNPKVRQASIDYSRRWAEAHPEIVREVKRAYKRRNPDVQRMATIRRRARIKGSGGYLSTTQWAAILDACGRRCLACGATEQTAKLTVDHVVPLAVGGSNDPANIQVLCMSCNVSKATRSTDYRDDQLRTALSAIGSAPAHRGSRRPATG